MTIEYFIVWDDGSKRAVIYGMRNGTREVASGRYTDALSAKGRSAGLVGWRKRSTAERHAKVFHVPVKIVELEAA
jgi:hypothetical protein